MKRILFIGETGSGKTTLMQYLNKKEQIYHKTQQVYFTENVIDTPGEFMENRFYYNALVSASVDADYVALVQSVTSKQNYFPPCFASRFTKPVIGIVTKIDLSMDKEVYEQAARRLKLAGAQKIFYLSVFANKGLDELEKFLSVG